MCSSDLGNLVWHLGSLVSSLFGFHFSVFVILLENVTDEHDRVKKSLREFHD